jgi:hypothetical protein
MSAAVAADLRHLNYIRLPGVFEEFVGIMSRLSLLVSLDFVYENLYSLLLSRRVFFYRTVFRTIFSAHCDGLERREFNKWMFSGLFPLTEYLRS